MVSVNACAGLLGPGLCLAWVGANRDRNQAGLRHHSNCPGIVLPPRSISDQAASHIWHRQMDLSPLILLAVAIDPKSLCDSQTLLLRLHIEQELRNQCLPARRAG